MPHMHGLELMERIKTFHPEIMSIMITANGDDTLIPQLPLPFLGVVYRFSVLNSLFLSYSTLIYVAKQVIVNRLLISKQ
jgi:CheY-like chemotaxis protein